MNIMLISVHGLSDERSTMVYLSSSLSFIITSPLAGLVMKKKMIPRRALIYIGYCIITTGMIISTGDFGKEPIFLLTIIGQVMSGIGLAIIFCCAMPEVVESIEWQNDLHC